jgi:dephospho-CoA kinase
VRDLVVERWGAEVATDGVVDRAAIAVHAFASPEERAWLERVLWPRVGTRVLAFREQACVQEPSPPAAVVETPLLFDDRDRRTGGAATGARRHAWARRRRRADRAPALAGGEGGARDVRRRQRRQRGAARTPAV